MRSREEKLLAKARKIARKIRALEDKHSDICLEVKRINEGK